MKTNRIEQALAIINNQQNACINPGHLGDMSYIDALNSIFGSTGETIQIKDREEQLKFNNLFLSSLAHRGKAKNIQRNLAATLFSEKWLLSDNKTFVSTRAKEIKVLEDVLMGIMLYLLGGFTFPDDSLREGPLKHIEVDMSEILAEPRKSFVLLNIDPTYMLLYMMWKIECLIQALGREYMFIDSPKHSRNLITYLRDKRKTYDNKCIEFSDSGSV